MDLIFVSYGNCLDFLCFCNEKYDRKMQNKLIDLLWFKSSWLMLFVSKKEEKKDMHGQLCVLFWNTIHIDLFLPFSS